jgi:hypothetical protein
MRILVATLAAVLVILIFLWITAERDRFVNPYEEVNWQAIDYFDANLHTHTTYSDGNHDPHQSIDHYHELGYRILALTDHDTCHYEVRPSTLYPWTSFNEIFHEIKDQPHGCRDGTFGDRANEEWQDRDPDQLDMLSVEGSEISKTHHHGSYHTHYADGPETEEQSFQEIEELGGIAMFFHPGRYDREIDWYVDHYLTYDHLVGTEVYNQVDRYPFDREKWDRVLHRLMPDRPVWGFANDDTHGNDHLGRNRNTFLLEDLSLEAFTNAIRKGHLYLFVPEERGVASDIRIHNIEASDNRIRLEIDGEPETFEWITHDPQTDESRIIHDRPEITLADVPGDAKFVRAVIISEAGRTYTQPFGIERAE